MSNRISIQFTNSASVCQFGISKPITNRNSSFEATRPINDPYSDTFAATRETVAVINRLLAIPGVSHLRFRTYEVHVTMAVAAFDWSDIQGKILAVLKEEYFGSDAVQIKGLTASISDGTDMDIGSLRRIRTHVTSSDSTRLFGISRSTVNQNPSWMNPSFEASMPFTEAYHDGFLATRETVAVINRLLAIPGVIHLRFRNYEVHVTIAVATFDWIELQSKILAVLKEEYFGNNETVNIQGITDSPTGGADLNLQTLQRIRMQGTSSESVRLFGVSKVTVNQHPSFPCPSFEVTKPVTEAYHDGFLATQETVAVINQLLAIPGVTHLRFRNYEVHVTIAVAVFDWNELQNQILAVLKKEYFGNSETVDMQDHINLPAE